MTDPRHPDAGRRYDAVAGLVRERLAARISLLSTFEGDRHFFIGAAGLPEELDRSREIPLVESFCDWVLRRGAQLVVDDVRLETRVAAHPMIGELGILSYAGWQVTDGEGRTIGVLSVMDDRPREWTSPELLFLSEQAGLCAPEVARAIAEGR
jgi:GAF domain-containing protein